MKKTKIKYSEEELSYIERHRELPRRQAWEDFQKKFGRGDVSFDNFKALCTRKGWKTGRTGRLEKGHVPHNTGKKMAYNANIARTQFKKGQIPPNANYLGHERLTKEGYVEINVAQKNPHTGYDRTYVLKHRYLWEKLNGKLPNGMCLKCVDGDRQNTDPSNWLAVPRGMLPFLNGRYGHAYDAMPEELKPAVLMLAKVKYAKGKAKRQKRCFEYNR